MDISHFELWQGEMPMQKVSHKGRFSRTIKFAIVFVGMAVLAMLGIKHFWITNELALKPPKRSRLQAEDPPDHVRLKTVSLPEAASRHLLDGDFTIVKQMERTTGGCRDIFESSFDSFSGKVASREQVVIADPGHAFEASDEIQGGLPFRRLEFAGLSKSGCFIYYQHGGSMFPRFCLAVMDNEHRKMLLVGEARKQARDFDQLRVMLLRGDFIDTTGPTC
jgi:hypothetical protein